MHLWLLACVIAVLLAVLPVPEWSIEQGYSRTVYPVLQAGLTSISNVVPIAILDLLILALVALTVWRLGRFFQMARRVGVLDALWDGFRRLLRAAAMVTILFYVFWGLNYRRVPLDESLHLPAFQPSVADLQLAIADANALATRVRPQVNSGTSPSYEDIARRLQAPFNEALKRLKRPALEVAGRPKYSMILTPFFTWSGVNGMIDPLALESIVHPDLLPFERPFVLAHEWGHLSGAADEAEASAIGWLACLQGDPVLAYSAALYLIEEAGANLPREQWRQALSKLDPGVREDLAAIGRRLAREKPEVQAAASRVYDTYLHANHVEDGVASYSRALQLILAAPIRDALNQYRVASDPDRSARQGP